MSDTQRITATLITDGPLRIGQGAPDERSELPVQRDQRGRPRIPGSSVAGALRAAAARRYPDRVESLFGTHQPRDTGERQAGHPIEPSRIHVADAVPAPPRYEDAADDEAATASTELTTEVRPRVGIDRTTLSAKTNVLFDAEWWPSGLPITVELTCPSEDTPAAIGSLEAMAAPDGGLGAGPCPVRLDGVTITPVERDAVRMLAAALARGRDAAAPRAPVGGRAPQPTAATAAPSRPGGWVRLDVRVQLVEPLACRLPLDPAMTAKEDPDNLPFPLATLDPHGGMAWTVGLPASALKGVLRQRAERACGFLAGSPVADPWNADGETPVTRLFGWASPSRTRIGAAGRLRCTDLRHPTAVGESESGADADRAHTADRQALRGPETVYHHPAYDSRRRVRIDRLTGSTLGTALFDDAFVKDGEPLDGALTLVDPHEEGNGSLPVDPRDLALLAVALRDLTEGLAGIGGSTRSGYGRVRLTDVTLAWGRAGEPAHADRTATVDVDDRGAIRWPDWLTDQLRQGWIRVQADVDSLQQPSATEAT